MGSSDIVRYEVQDGIAVVTIDNPPVNALGPGVAEGIVAAVERANADPDVRAAILIGAGRTFIAGADIGAFGTGPRPPRRSYGVLDASAKPVVAAIHGFALGGGLEHALACHYRVAVASAALGLPEVTLGIIPGGGGTQRLPRLIGAGPALDMIVGGRHVPAAEALALGVIDAVIEGDLRAGAVRFAQGVAGHRPLPRVRDRAVSADPALFEAKRRSIARSARNQRAPYACIEAVEAACALPFDEGLVRERALFAPLENAREARALRHAFFAEREAARMPGLPRDTPVRPVRSVAIIGAGTMGSGIAMTLADRGIPVMLMEASPEALERGMARVRDTYAVSVRRGSLAAAEMEARLARIEPAASYDAIGGCDAVIEAVFEELPAKTAVFAQLDRVMKPGALLLTNTSALSIDAIAAATSRPGDVAGAHFFSPANVMKLLEVVAGTRTAPGTLASVLQFGRAAGKVAAVAHDCDGFAANRSRAPFNAEMNILLEEGALPHQVDAVMVAFGYPMGPFAVGDLAGLDISYAARRRRAAADPGFRKLPIADRLVEAGRKGQKTGAGWYRYDTGDRTPHRDEEAERIIAETAAALGVEQRTFTDEEILHRLLFASVNEGCRLLEEGIIHRAGDLDAMWLNGFGFPRYRGGPMFWADGIGARAIHDQVADWHRRYGPRWAPAALLARLAAEGGTFLGAPGRA